MNVRDGVPDRVLIKLYDKHNGNFAAMGRESGISRERVRQRMNRLGYNSASYKGSGKVIAKEVRKYAKQGMTMQEIATKLNKSYGYIVKIAACNNITTVKPKRKLKYPNEVLIKLYKKCKGSYKRMAEELELKESTISKLMSHRNLNIKYPGMGRCRLL